MNTMFESTKDILIDIKNEIKLMESVSDLTAEGIRAQGAEMIGQLRNVVSSYEIDNEKRSNDLALELEAITLKHSDALMSMPSVLNTAFQHELGNVLSEFRGQFESIDHVAENIRGELVLLTSNIGTASKAVDSLGSTVAFATSEIQEQIKQVNLATQVQSEATQAMSELTASLTELRQQALDELFNLTSITAGIRENLRKDIYGHPGINQLLSWIGFAYPWVLRILFQDERYYQAVETLPIWTFLKVVIQVAWYLAQSLCSTGMVSVSELRLGYVDMMAIYCDRV
ncbi:hypothetical protein C8Q75DRAFT_111789 [Abortiporus biennis]|nr:hypothetical protein C8Q75DRAFT_111789 [Abortiporus biennis]